MNTFGDNDDHEEDRGDLLKVLTRSLVKFE